jgi:ligand-binding SRPBCC domain-containing protein
MSIIRPHESLPAKHTLQTELWLPRDIRDVFDFFADAHRLEEITPPWLHFHVMTPKPVLMFAGTKIDYRLRLHGLPVRWQSEISEWEPPFRFVDRQLIGPYRLWCHQHTFEERDGGTLVKDRVDYAVPGGWLIHWLFVRRDLERIFAFRHAKLIEILGQSAQTSVTA